MVSSPPPHASIKQHVQCNPTVLPLKYAHSFVSLSAKAGQSPVHQSGPANHSMPLAEGVDLITDLPLHHHIYLSQRHAPDPRGPRIFLTMVKGQHWFLDRFVFFRTFLDQCRVSPGANVVQASPSRPVLTFKATITPTGGFSEGVVVVSAKPYRTADLQGVKRVARGLPKQHEEPIVCGREEASSGHFGHLRED
jgi:uncharacterized protein YcsI (UPF0317 family)